MKIHRHQNHQQGWKCRKCAAAQCVQILRCRFRYLDLKKICINFMFRYCGHDFMDKIFVMQIRSGEVG